jgi:hypothetical protein
MGCVNGKPVLREQDLEFIATHTAISREEVDKQYENFLQKHPDGKIRCRFCGFSTIEPNNFGQNYLIHFLSAVLD